LSDVQVDLRQNMASIAEVEEAIGVGGAQREPTSADYGVLDIPEHLSSMSPVCIGP